MRRLRQLGHGRHLLLAALLLIGMCLGTSEAWSDSGSGLSSGPWTMAPLHVLVYSLALAVLASGMLSGRSEAGAPMSEDSLAGLCHGIRTPLNAVIGFSELMLAEVHGPLGHPKYVDYAKHVSESGTQLAEVAEQLLQVKSLASGQDLPAVR
jgi:signal transduction histidine kinase